MPLTPNASKQGVSLRHSKEQSDALCCRLSPSTLAVDGVPFFMHQTTSHGSLQCKELENGSLSAEQQRQNLSLLAPPAAGARISGPSLVVSRSNAKTKTNLIIATNLFVMTTDTNSQLW